MGAAHEVSSSTESLYEPLRAALSSHRGDESAACAATLLASQYDDRVLLGLVDGGTRAVYYSGLTRCVAAVPYDSDEVHIEAAHPLGQAIDDPKRWVAVADPDWDWLAPAFR